MAEHGSSGEMGELEPADLNGLRDEIAAGEDGKVQTPPDEGMSETKPGGPSEQGDELDDLAGLRAQLEKDRGPLGESARSGEE